MFKKLIFKSNNQNLAIEEEEQQQIAASSSTTIQPEIPSSSTIPTSSIYDFDTPKTPEYFRQAFVTDLLGLLTEKLHTFWKISQNFAVTGQVAMAMATSASLAEAAEMQERQMDIDVIFYLNDSSSKNIK